MALRGKQPTATSVGKFRGGLLGWYDAKRRDLPWRKDRNPYKVWVSEIMLQQTRVAAVLEHYRKFLDRFPDVFRLAKAREADVLAAWSGLGYYRRARALHAAAKQIAKNQGRFPENAEGLKSLPGIGRYTAAAIASIAFNEPVAVVDGNVERVFSRVQGKDMSGSEEVWKCAQHYLDPSRPGDWNQAVMELGALVCTPVSPKCVECPVQKWCKGPGTRTRKSDEPRKRNRMSYGLAQRRGTVYLVRRPPNDSLMAGMWELPSVPKADSEPLLRTRHSITTTDFEVEVHPINATEISGGRWIRLSRLPQVAVTGLTRKILRAAKLWPQD